MNYCLNCGEAATAKFCSNCGQKQGVNRLTWRTVFDDLQKRLLGFDNNFLRTLKDLTIRPHVVIASSIEGVRVRYIGPVGYYFLMLTIYVLVISITGIDMAEASNNLSQSLNGDTSSEQLAIQLKWNGFVAENIRIISFVMLPFFITGVWLVFKNKGYNFLETSVITFYGQAHPIWISVMAIITVTVTGGKLPLTWLSVLSYLYLTIIITAFYKGNKIWNFIKGLLALVLGLVLLIVFAMLTGFLLAVVNPELFEGFKPA